MRKPIRVSRFVTTVDLAWSLDALVDTRTGVVTLIVTNGAPRAGAKRLRRFETAGEAENARRLMVAGARQGALVAVA